MRSKIKLDVNCRDEVKVKRRPDLFWVNYHFNFIPWQLKRLPLNWWNGKHIVCSDLTFSLGASECDSALMNLLSSLIPSGRCTAARQDWHLRCANTRLNTWWIWKRRRRRRRKWRKNNILQLHGTAGDTEQAAISITFIFLFRLLQGNNFSEWN